MNLRLWLRILLIDAIDLHEIPGNLTTYFHLDHSINVEFVNWPLISMHDVCLCLKFLTESKKCREHETLILMVRFTQGINGSFPASPPHLLSPPPPFFFSFPPPPSPISDTTSTFISFLHISHYRELNIYLYREIFFFNFERVLHIKYATPLIFICYLSWERSFT